jgi:serine/threonine protein kinase
MNTSISTFYAHTVLYDSSRGLSLLVCVAAGTLLDHVSGSELDELDTSLLLSYCHDVANGLHYLSSRKMVHRDIAARNVSTGHIHCCFHVYTCILSIPMIATILCKTCDTLIPDES